LLVRIKGASQKRTTARLNELCALKAAAKFLNLPLPALGNFLPEGHTPAAEIIPSYDFLASIVQRGNKIIVDSATIVHFRDLPIYYEYNANNDISWREIGDLQRMTKVFEMWASKSPTIT
jgi:hypothetical protein